MSQDEEPTVVVETLEDGTRRLLPEETYEWHHHLCDYGFEADTSFSARTPRFETGCFCHPSWRGKVTYKEGAFKLSLPYPKVEPEDEDLSCSWRISEVSATFEPSSDGGIVPMSMTKQGPTGSKGWSQGEPEVFVGQYNYARMGLRPDCSKLNISVKIMGQRSDLSTAGELVMKADLTSVIPTLFNSPEFSDFQVLCEDETFLCHKSILGVGSPVFKQMFLTLNTIEAIQGRVRIEDVSKGTLQLMLKWMYGEDIGQKMTTFEERVELYKLANRYLMGDLKNSLVQDICRSVTPEAAFDLYLLGDTYSDDMVKSKATEVMKRDKKRAFPSEVFHECYKRFPGLLEEILKEN